MSRGKTIRPSYYDEEESSQDELSHTLNKGRSNIGSQSDDEEMSKYHLVLSIELKPN